MNAGPTHQRVMQKSLGILHKQVECYVADLVVKSKQKKSTWTTFILCSNNFKSVNSKWILLNVHLALVLESFLDLSYGTIVLR